MKPFPSLMKRIEVFEEEKKDANCPFAPHPIKFTVKDAPTKRSSESMHKRTKQRRLDMGHFNPCKAKRPAFFWVLYPARNTTTTTTMATNTQIATTNPPMTTSCKTCRKWGAPCPFCVQSAPHPSPQESDWSHEDWNGDRQREREEEKKKETRQKEEKNKREQVPYVYYPPSPILTQPSKTMACPIVIQKENKS